MTRLDVPPRIRGARQTSHLSWRSHEKQHERHSYVAPEDVQVSVEGNRSTRKRFPEVPLLRYIDDILILCRSVDESIQAHEELEKMLTAAGMPLKYPREKAIRDLSLDEHAVFLGYRCSMNGDCLEVRIARRAVESLLMGLAEVAGDPNVGVLAGRRIVSWLLAAGPGYVADYAEEICCEIQSAIYDLRLEGTEMRLPGDRTLDLASASQLQALWRRLHKNWRRGRPSLDDAALSLPGCWAPRLHMAPTEGLCVDASWVEEDSQMEYRGVWLHDRALAFEEEPITMGSNNIAEFLAVVQGLRLLNEMGSSAPLYSDSETAIKWVANREARPQVPRSKAVERKLGVAIQWLRANSPANLVLKWDTEAWGEIPADYGRK